ncbi:MAG: hypothetical protein Q9183_001252 [Haloplaca sp. 2 TL-2023]
MDLSNGLSSTHRGAKVKAKAFAVPQNINNLASDLALVLTVGSTDYLYPSLGNLNTDSSWARGIRWKLVPFDDSPKQPAASPLTTFNVYLMNRPNTSQAQTCFVDIWRTPPATNPLRMLDRYYILPKGPPKWRLQQLAIDLAAGSISSCLGRGSKDLTEGIYTYGTIGGKAQQTLSYTKY